MKRHIPLPTRRDSLMLLIGAVLVLAGVLIVTAIDHAQVPLRPQSPGLTTSWLPDTVTRWQSPIDAMAKKYNIDPNLLAIIMTLESGGSPKADSGEATGLMQITPVTGKEIAGKFLKHPVSSYKLTDPNTSIEFGAAYLAWLRDQFGSYHQGPSWDSTVELMAAGYNGGPGAANRLEQGKGLTDTQTVVYSRDAFNMWRERQASDSPTYDRWLERGGSILINNAKANK